MRGLLARFALLGASLMFVAGLAEVAFRLLGYTSIYAVYSKPSLFWAHDEVLGWSHQPGAEGVYLGPRPFPVEFEAPVQINSLGLRGPEIGPREPGELRLLFLGDSVVAGLEVAYEDTFVDVFGQGLTRRLGRFVRTINAAVRGYGTDQSLLYYRERGRRLDPDVVFFVHSENDPNDNVTLHRARRPFGKPAFALAADGSLKVVGQPVRPYPLCSAWMLGASGAPVNIDTFSTRLACFLQTRLADHSVAFGVVARSIARWPDLTEFLKNLTQPPEQQERRDMGRALELPPPVRQAGFPGAATAGAAEPLASGVELTTALIRALAAEVRRDGAEFRLLLTKIEDLEQVDLEKLAADGLDGRLLTTTAPQELLHWQNDGHLNEYGHRHVAQLLLQGFTRELRALARARSPRTAVPGRAQPPGPG